MTKQTKIIVLVGSVLAVLLAAVIVIGVLILNAQPELSGEDQFWSCMNSQGFERDETLADSGKTMDEYQAAADECGAD